MRATFLVICLAILPFAAFSQAYMALNRLVVVPLNSQDFEVIEARGEGPRGIWCAAASFAIYRMGMQGGGEIYVKRPRGPSVSGVGRTGVVFTNNPANLTPTRSYSISVRQKGLALPVAHAVQFCKDYIFDLDDLFP